MITNFHQVSTGLFELQLSRDRWPIHTRIQGDDVGAARNLHNGDIILIFDRVDDFNFWVVHALTSQGVGYIMLQKDIDFIDFVDYEISFRSL